MRLLEDLKSVERDSRFEWTLAEISLHSNVAEITDSVLKGWGNAATIMHLIAKRSLKASYNALDVYNALMKPPPPPPPPLPVVSPIIINSSPVSRKKSRYVDSSSDSDSDTTFRSIDSSVGYVRRRLRRNKARKARKSFRGKYSFDSDYDSESEDGEDEDIIAINLQLKRGDDIVKILLDRWTPEVDGKGKGKEVAV
jgi:hypothetical protein